MSEELTEELNEEMKKRKKVADYVVEIRNTKDDEPEDLQEQLEREKRKNEDLSLIVEVEATKQFMTEKENLLKNIPEGRREKISEFIGEDPEKIEQVKASLILQGQNFGEDEDEENEPTIAGRATLPDYMLPQNQGRQIRSSSYSNPVIQQYSDLYRLIRDPKTSERKRQEAEAILDEAFDEIGKGLRSRPRNDPYRLPSGTVSHCLKCGHVVEADLTKVSCPYCGYNFSKDKFPRNPKFEPR
jgi:rubrerythrin